MKVIVIIIAMVVPIMMSATFACTYGNGGGEAEIANSFGMGKVGWSTGPVGLTVAGSPIWHGRPTIIEKGPALRERAVWEHEQELLDGFKSNKYTKENVKTTLEWAKKVGFHISDDAQKTLDALSPKKDFSLDNVSPANGTPSPQNLIGNPTMLALLVSSEQKISSKEAFVLILMLFTVQTIADDDV